MSSYAPIPPSADSLERMRALVEQDETRLKRSRAVRLRRRLCDTGLPRLQAALRRLVLIALVSAVVLVLIVALASALAIVLVPSGGNGTGALAPVRTWVAAAWTTPDTAAAITRAALAAPHTAAAFIAVAVASLTLPLCASEIVADLRRTTLR